jgi:two-component system KDP operon response regulator KdpE
LESETYEVFTAADGEAGLAEYARTQPDLVIMDINMPRMNGLQAISKLREFSGVPVLILSVRGVEEDKVAGLDVGADDYLAKPFGANELLARVRALLRRSAHQELATAPRVLRLGGGELVIDRATRRVLVGGQLVHLTPIEAKLLFTLAEDPGKTFTRKDLIGSVWGDDSSGTSQNLKLYTLYLRRKIEADPEQPRFLLTVRGIGYALAVI